MVNEQATSEIGILKITNTGWKYSAGKMQFKN